MAFLLSLLLFLTLFMSSLSCPSHCAVCLNAIYICNKWKSTYDLSSQNSIATINSNAFINANQMIELDISNNVVSSLESNAFNGLVSLQTLNLSHNALTSLPDNIFQPLVNLRTLDLSHNDIHDLDPQSFYGLTNLTKLYLNSNQLSTLTGSNINDLFSNLPSLQNITLSGNSWHCDCNISQLQAVLLSPSSKVSDPATVTCQTPPDLSNTPVNSLNLYDNPLCFTSSPSPSPSLFVSPSPSLFVISSSPEVLLSSTLLPVFSSSLEFLSPSPSIVLSSSLPLSLVSLSPSPLLVSPVSSILSPYSSSSFTLSSSLPLYSLPGLSSSLLYSSEYLPSSFTSSSLYTEILYSPSSYTSTVSPSPSIILDTSSSDQLATSSSISTLSYTPTPSASVSSSSSQFVSSTPSSSSVSPSPSPSPSPSSSPSPSPSPTPHCPANTTVTDVGSLHWPAALVGRSVSASCPYGPSSGVVTRYCILIPGTSEAVWGAIEDGACFTADNRLQQLIYQTIDDDNVLMLSEELADLPFNHLSSSGIDYFTTVISRIFQYGSNNITVIVNVLSAIDLLLASDSAQALMNSDNSENIHSIITTALLGAVNANNTQQILQFSRLLIGAKHVQESEVVAEIEVLGEGRLSFVPVGANATGEIIIDIRSNDLGGHTVQVTVYNDSVLFSSNCLSTGPGVSTCNTLILSPIAVTSVNGLLGDERINITFENIMHDSSAVLYCAMWNANISNGGQWDSSDCDTHIMTGSVMCSCSATGSVAVLQVISTNTTGNPTNTGTPSNTYTSLVFYISSGLGVLLHLPIIIITARISYKYDIVRNIQALLHHSITHMLVLIAMIISFQRNEIQELCLALGSFLHYIILVSYMWMIFRIVIICMSQIRYKKLYERDCFILPFFFIAWSLPIIPVVLYGVLAFTNNQEFDDTHNCWIESFTFPSYFVYLCVVCTVLLLLLLLTAIPLLACSSFVVNSSSYYQLLGMFIETLFFSGMIAMHFLAASQDSDALLAILCAVILLCSGYYFISNAIARTKMRKTLFCQEEKSNYSKGKPYLGQETPTTSTSSMSERAKKRRQRQFPFPVRMTHELNLDYLGGYTGYPIELWNEVGDGRRVRKKTEFFSDHRTRGSSEV